MKTNKVNVKQSIRGKRRNADMQRENKTQRIRRKRRGTGSERIRQRGYEERGETQAERE